MKHPEHPSKEHLAYLKNTRKKTTYVFVLRFAVLLLLLGVWELAAALQWVNPFITSSPSRILATIGEMYQSGSLFYHVGTT